MSSGKDNSAHQNYRSLAEAGFAVLPPLRSVMKVCFLFDDNGEAWILHDKPLSDIVKWAEYDAETGRVVLTMRSGKTQDLGLVIPENICKTIGHQDIIGIYYTKDGHIADAAAVPLIVRDVVFH